MFSSLISVDELSNQLNADDWRIVDCRYDLSQPQAGREAWLESHIPGAVFADVHDDLSGEPLTDCGRHPMLSVEAMQALFERLGISNGTQVVVYDDSFGAFAGRLWWMLRYMGHTQVAVLNGGWRAWNNAEQTVTEVDTTTPESARFTPNVKHDRLVLLEEAQQIQGLYDSREPARYRGEVEPIDPVAGHIPGAINRFWQENLDKDKGLFKPAEQLAKEFSELFQAENSAEKVFYCGSGVTACHNVLAVTYSGLAMPRLYAGSWSEWCADAIRPVATVEA